MKKPRCLVLDNSIAPTGALNAILRNTIRLRESFDFDFVLPAGSQAKNAVEKEGWDVTEISMLEISKKIFSLFFYLPVLLLNTRLFFKVVKRVDPQIIHNNDFYNLLPPLYRFFGGRVPYICYVRFLPARFPSLLRKAWFALHYRYASAIVAVSQAVLAQLPPHKKNILVYDGLPDNADKDFVPLPDSKNILYLSNYTPGKGQEFALKAFARIHQEFPGWKLNFFGGDMGMEKNIRFRQELEQMARELDISDVVTFNDFLIDIGECYKRAELVLNFSFSESFSLTCLEAQCYGRPVIATRSGGPAEIVDDNVSGFLVDVGDVTAMASRMTQLMGNENLRTGIGRAAFESVRKKFASENTTDRLAQIYVREMKSDKS